MHREKGFTILSGTSYSFSLSSLSNNAINQGAIQHFFSTKMLTWNLNFVTLEMKLLYSKSAALFVVSIHTIVIQFFNLTFSTSILSLAYYSFYISSPIETSQLSKCCSSLRTIQPVFLFSLLHLIHFEIFSFFWDCFVLYAYSISPILFFMVLLWSEFLWWWNICYVT